MRLAASLQGWPPRAAARVAFGLVVAVGTAEALSGFEVSLLLLYAVPVALAAWAVTPRAAYTLAAVAVTLPTPFAALAGEPIGWAVIWSVLSNFVLLGIIVMLLTTLRRRLSDEAAFVATDTLTGLLNRGSFIAQLDAELTRAARYGRAFTLAYVDLDNFKAVNDLEGHDAGDELLRRIADALRSSTRQTDVLGRLGGDEFAAVLPEITGRCHRIGARESAKATHPGHGERWVAGDVQHRRRDVRDADRHEPRGTPGRGWSDVRSETLR